ncbi:MAG TPA: hypothetical protein VIK31_03270 [Propionibacteriaceae bacterium]
MGPVLRATRVALKAAALTVLSGPDAGSVAVLLRLAATIDRMDTPDEPLDEGERRPRKAFDNVSIPTYLKYAEALGLTPAARAVASGTPIESEMGGGVRGGSLGAVLTLAAQATG